MVKLSATEMFEGYAYSYPHKHSYRQLGMVPLPQLWKDEKKDALFLYIHLPFCEMRCGFCNLFTIAHPREHIVDSYLNTLELEATVMKEHIAPEGFGQLAVGGGTPTFLSHHQLEKLFYIIRGLGCDLNTIPVSFETSPATITREKLALLSAQGVDRVSMGIQSFLEPELKALGRPQQNNEVYHALELLKQFPFKTINVDLIYGVSGQTVSSWLHSVLEVVRYGIQEVFIYPLYIRPLTGITKMKQAQDDNRFLFYREAKQLLLSSGYQQVSMRMFQKKEVNQQQHARTYSCQEDGMIGLGAGARSYTRSVHYSSEYAVRRQNIHSIIEKYIARTDFCYADYGIVLSQEEQQRRFIIKSILHNSGLDLTRYFSLFGNHALTEYSILQNLIESELAVLQNGILRLTETGLDYSDVIGPRLYSEPIRELITEFELQ